MLIYYAAKEKQKGRKHERRFISGCWKTACIFAIGLRWTICTISSAAAVFSAATAVLGSLLQIKRCACGRRGHLINMTKAKGRKASLRALVDRMEQTAIDPAQQTVSSAWRLRTERTMLPTGASAHGRKKGDRRPVGPDIGAHSGCGTMALFFFVAQKDKRRVLWRARRKIRCARFCFAFSGRTSPWALNLAGSNAAFVLVQYRQATHFVKQNLLPQEHRRCDAVQK
jgi:hypothetical protein